MGDREYVLNLLVEAQADIADIDDDLVAEPQNAALASIARSLLAIANLAYEQRLINDVGSR
jgi:hypothetical protein